MHTILSIMGIILCLTVPIIIVAMLVGLESEE